jgi:hypothetical protein
VAARIKAGRGRGRGLFYEDTSGGASLDDARAQGLRRHGSRRRRAEGAAKGRARAEGRCILAAPAHDSWRREANTPRQRRWVGGVRRQGRAQCRWNERGNRWGRRTVGGMMGTMVVVVRQPRQGGCCCRGHMGSLTGRAQQRGAGRRRPQGRVAPSRESAAAG